MTSTYSLGPSDLTERYTTLSISDKAMKRKPVPGGVRSPSVKVHVKEIQEPIKEIRKYRDSKATATSSTKTANEKTNPPCPHLEMPIVIPGVLNHTTNSNIVGLPFVRGYAACLGHDYDISLLDFLAFIDELNILNRGHLAINYISKIGSVVELSGHFDPTNITKLVGKSITLGAHLARWASINGPLSRKKDFLSVMNSEVFNPKGLMVEIMDSKTLRRFLGLAKDAPLIAPLCDRWTVPTLEQMKQKHRAQVRVPHRLILGLLPLVHDISLYGEKSATPLPENASSLRKKAAQEVLNWQYASETRLELARGEALANLRAANKAGSEKERVKLLKASRQKDKEVHAVNKAHWVVIKNLTP